MAACVDIIKDTDNKKPFCVGLTGGIGSGKTTVSNFFAALGVPIIDADVISHQLTQTGGAAYPNIVSHFGNMILDSNTEIDRKKLRDIIFSNPIEKKWLENVLHPLIRKTMRNAISKVTYPYCICAIPLLAESTEIHFIDRVLVIDAPIEIQIARAKKRDQSSEANIQKIIDSQVSNDARLKMADDIIVNDSTLLSIEKKVLILHQLYLSLSIKP